MDIISKKLIKQYAESLSLKEVNLPVALSNGKKSVIFEHLNGILSMLHEMQKLQLPNFERTKTVAIFSDYGGESSTSKYLTYTTTLVDYDFLAPFIDEIGKIREKHGLNDPYKEIAFKSLSYYPVKNCLDDYLRTVNNSVNGLVFTLLVNKNVFSLSGANKADTKKEIVKILESGGYGVWKPDVAEKLIRISHIIAYWCNLLIGKDKKVFWMTDADSIAANEEKAKKSAGLIYNMIQACEGYEPYEIFGYASEPFKNDFVSRFIDLLSVSDLIAGSIEHYYTKKIDSNEPQIKDEADKILCWMTGQGIAMKKLCVKLETEDKQLKCSLVNFSEKEPSANIEYIDSDYNVKVNFRKS